VKQGSRPSRNLYQIRFFASGRYRKPHFAQMRPRVAEHGKAGSLKARDFGKDFGEVVLRRGIEPRKGVVGGKKTSLLLERHDALM
jgi:hypothetical protein